MRTPRRPDGQFMLDDEGLIVDWDVGAEALTGTRRADALGKPCYVAMQKQSRSVAPSLCGPECPAFHVLRDGCLKAGAHASSQRGSRATTRVTCALTALPPPSGGAIGAIRSEDPERAEEAREPAITSPTLANTAQDLAVVALLAATPLRRPLRASLARSLDLLREAASADAAELFFAEREGHNAVLACHRGRFRRDFAEIMRFARGEGFPGLILRTRQPIVATRVAADPRYLRGRVKARGFSGYVCVPLLTEDRVLGSVHLAFRRTGADLDRTLRLLQWAAIPISSNIELALWRSQARFGARTQRSHGNAIWFGWSTPATARETAPLAVAPSEATLDIRCFGRFRVLRNGRPVDPEAFRRRASWTLLKVLVTHGGKPAPIDQLAETLWPDTPADKSRGRVHVTVHELRRVLEPDSAPPNWRFIQRKGDTYYFNLGAGCRIDVVEFKEALRTGAGDSGRSNSRSHVIRACEHATALYAGEFLEDEPYAEWACVEREQLRESYLSLLIRAAAQGRDLRDWARATEFLRRAVRIDPSREEAHRELMRALWALGRRDEAVRQYQACRDALARDLAVAPLPETEILLKRIQESPLPQTPAVS